MAGLLTGNKTAKRGEPLRFLQNVVLPYSGDECLIWPFSRNDSGYGQISWNGKPERVHRIVCEEHHGPAPEGRPDVAHSCGRGGEGCVTARHLRWADKRENFADSVTHGTAAVGERSGRATLTWAEVDQIRSLQGAASQRAIAARFGVSQSIVSRILSGKNWVMA